jgi:hypothetical protein
MHYFHFFGKPDGGRERILLFVPWPVNAIEFLFSGKEDESAMREYTLTLSDRDGGHNLTRPEGKKT